MFCLIMGGHCLLLAHMTLFQMEKQARYVQVGSPLKNTMIPMGAVTLIGISTQYIAPQNPSIPDSYRNSSQR